jgi:hypothetical protein
MKAIIAAGIVSLLVAIAPNGASPDEASYALLDKGAQPLRSAFNEDAGKTRLVMYVSPTCGGCLRGAEQSQEYILDTIDSKDLSVYVVWAPKNGAREEHVERVTRLVTDDRAVQYWDEYSAVAGPLDDMLSLTGPCAGIFMLYDGDANWDGIAPPEPVYWEDAHARELNRDGAPQFDPEGFAEKVRELLASGD